MQHPIDIANLPGTPRPVRLKTEPPDRQGQNPAAAPEDSVDAETQKARLVLCRECLHPITREQDRTEVHGAHRHIFANPGGIVFTIGCFQTAEGCGAAGSPSDEFTWFKGFNWRVAVCTGCLAHLGWLFTTTSGAAFWGLILDHLIFPDDS
ncbi:MAG: hypothetical protein JJV98_07375 [Desulfosarcina sp.]|nr:hypothetical protein [Desulfobacterales bacterium]